MNDIAHTVAIALLWFIGLPVAAALAPVSPIAAGLGVVLLLHLLVNVAVRCIGIWRYRRWAKAQPWTSAGTLPASVSWTAGEGADAVLLVHGFCDAAYVWKRQGARLAAAGCHVSAVQLAGFGARGLPDKSAADWQAQLTDRIAALGATHRRVFVMAHSFGCSLALDAAYRHRRYGLAPIAGLILLAPLIAPQPCNRWGIPFRWYYALRRWLLPLTLCLPSMFRETVKGEDDPDFTFRRDAFMRASHLVSLMRILARIRGFDRTFVDVPVRVFLAGDDRLVDSEATRRWLAGTRAPCAFSVVPGAKHALPTARSWRETCDAAVEFMRAL